MGQRHAACRQCAEQAGLGHAAGDDESELHYEVGSVVAGFVHMKESITLR